jgi:hypothetical protein
MLGFIPCCWEHIRALSFLSQSIEPCNLYRYIGASGSSSRLSTVGRGFGAFSPKFRQIIKYYTKNSIHIQAFSASFGENFKKNSPLTFQKRLPASIGAAATLKRTPAPSNRRTLTYAREPPRFLVLGKYPQAPRLSCRPNPLDRPERPANVSRRLL